MKIKFLDAMYFRHACKEFDLKKKISEDDFSTILEIGRLSPSSFGFEPWQFIVVQNKELRNKMKEFTWGGQGQLPTASHFVIILSRKKKDMVFDSKYILNMMKDIQKLPEDVVEMKGGFYKKFQEEDFEIMDDTAMFDWATKQTYLPLGNMMTGAAYMGIDSCPIEGFDMKKTIDFIKNELKIDTQKYGVACMVAFGYRKTEPREKTRQDINAITKWYK